MPNEEAWVLLRDGSYKGDFLIPRAMGIKLTRSYFLAASRNHSLTYGTDQMAFMASMGGLSQLLTMPLSALMTARRSLASRKRETRA